MRIKFNKAAFAELRTSAMANDLVDEQADATSGRANAIPSTTVPAATEDYYEVEDGSDAKRARRRVRTANPRAIRHEAKTQALLKGL